MSSITKRIFPNDDSLNLEQSIRTDISRFNKRVKELTGFDLICSSRNMGYRINPELEIITDFDVLQDRMIVASEIKSESGRIRALMDLVNTYRGGLYESHNNEGWVYAFAKSIHGIFLKNAEELLELLYKTGDYQNLLLYVSKLLFIEPQHTTFLAWDYVALKKMKDEKLSAEILERDKQELEESDFMEFEGIVKRILGR